MSKIYDRGHAVKVILASKSKGTGTELWTIHARYWRAIHAEVMTHRVFSRNAGSSRAKPVRKVLSQVWNNPAGPSHWGANQAGMQARVELVGWRKALAGGLWRASGKVACVFAWGMMKLDLHKQVANRILEPWQYIDVLISATDWDNFFELRDHPDAQPEFQALAREIGWRMAVHRSEDLVQELDHGQWHIPYVTPDETRALPVVTLLKLSSARSARISYEPFDGNGSIVKEIARHDDLVGSRPWHASPTEHQAVAMQGRHANFQDFLQYRWHIEHGVAVQEPQPSMFPDE